jgi:BlaI family transcriptional regulator, penicillinase repressor
MTNRPELSDAEMEVLKVLWDHESGATVRVIRETLEARGRSWAYTTVATLIQRLGTKGYSECSSDDVPHKYRSTVSRDDLLERRLEDAANELCEGSATPLVLALVQGNRFTPEELDRFRRLIDDARARAKILDPK